MIITKYRVYDENKIYHGSFRELKDAQEHAQEMANETNSDMFIDKLTVEVLECVIPD